MIDDLNKILKKYVAIFINEYSDFLSLEQLESLKSINFSDAIKEADIPKPFGIVSLDRIYLSKTSNELINNLRNMPGYNTNHCELNNKNMSSYLKYMCDNGYDINDYYSDILMYFVFRYVIKNTSGFINGLINQEMKYISIKYSLRLANLYAREEAIVNKISPIIGLNSCRKILFLDKASAFKYLNDNHGFRVAKLVNDIDILMEDVYGTIEKKEYHDYNGFLDYIDDYDHLLYGDVYNYILDYEIENSLIN